MGGYITPEGRVLQVEEYIEYLEKANEDLQREVERLQTKDPLDPDDDVVGYWRRQGDPRG
jgi:hypothetical protein